MILATLLACIAVSLAEPELIQEACRSGRACLCPEAGRSPTAAPGSTTSPLCDRRGEDQDGREIGVGGGTGLETAQMGSGRVRGDQETVQELYSTGPFERLRVGTTILLVDGP